MRRHRAGRGIQAAEGDEIVRRSAAGRGDAGQRLVAVGAGAAVAGYVLDDRQHAAVEEAVDRRAAELDHHRGIARIGAVADDVVGALGGHVEHRRAIDGDAEIVEFVRDQPRAQIGGIAGPFGIAVA